MPRRRFDRQYKIAAIQLVLQEGRTVTGVAKELGIHENTLYRWIIEYETRGENAFPGNGSPVTNKDFELKKMKKKIADLEMEIDILKKFHAFLKKSQ